MPRLPRKEGLAALILLLLLAAGAWVHQSIPPDNTTDRDIYWNYRDGLRLLNGENPYARIQASDMLKNNKYSTYFPLFYYLSYATQRAGLRDYDSWIAFWRVVFLLFTLACASLLYWTFYARGHPGLAAFATAFWLLSRWNLFITNVGYVDPVPLFCVLLSLALFDRRRWASLFLLSVSLAFKQMAVFLVPLYLIWVWQAAGSPAGRPDGAAGQRPFGLARRARLREVALAAAAIASIPILSSLPFLAWDARSFLQSIVFNTTRGAATHVGAAAPVGTWLGFNGLPARLPMFLMIAWTYLLAWRQQVGRYTSILFAMAGFIDFSPVMFLQYFAWLAPFVLLVAADPLPLLRPRASAAAATALERERHLVENPFRLTVGSTRRRRDSP